uniref:Uncharacterized protein n=1 Tax=Eptatretus burgeri TaxID=7764 RepID=A0A8C4Q5N9_EPTBU
MVHTRRSNAADLDSSNELVTLRPKAACPAKVLQTSEDQNLSVSQRSSISDAGSVQDMPPRKRKRTGISQERYHTRPVDLLDREALSPSKWKRTNRGQEERRCRLPKNKGSRLRKELSDLGSVDCSRLDLMNQKAKASGIARFGLVNGPGHVAVRRSKRVRQCRYSTLNQSLLIEDQFVSNTAEAVLQEMEKIGSERESNLHRNRCARELERLRIWHDTEDVSPGSSEMPVRVRHN